MTRVHDELEKYKRVHGEDDIDYATFSNALPDDERELWHKEMELAIELRKKYGTRPDFDEIVEREIYARGLEAK